MNLIAGLSGPSGAECESLDSFTVYIKDVPPGAIAVSRLEFEESAVLSDIFGTKREEVNLWVPKEQVEIDVKPVGKHPDMYFAVPRKPLAKGFYVLHIGNFASEMPIRSSEVYDIVVGAAKDFPSHKVTVQNREVSIREASSELLVRMNEMFNSRRFEKLGEVYRPQGNALSGTELNDFLRGNETWFGNAGKVVKSEITQVAASEDGLTAHCAVATQYEKAGQQTESLVVSKIGDRFFITEMK
ncbi:MAG TPA: hypothetical protein VF173_21660 [Thermoanaerobaculia bacterium]|nr:hypothetical protein [Thermoanaerobaculia bacterium]